MCVHRLCFHRCMFFTIGSVKQKQSMKTKAWLWESIDLRKKMKRNERVVVCAHRLWLHRSIFFRTIDCSFGEKKFNSKRCVSNERPHFTFNSYKLLIKFCFLCAGFAGYIQRYNCIIIQDAIHICKLGLFVIQWIIICLMVIQPNSPFVNENQ